MKNKKKLMMGIAVATLFSATYFLPPIATVHAYEHENTTNTLSADVEITIDDSHFPNKTFKECVAKFDIDGDNKLSSEEIAKVTMISVANNSAIDSLEGIEYFTNLKNLYCGETAITNLDLSKNNKLEILHCEKIPLKNLDISSNPALEILNCSGAKLETITFGNNISLTQLLCQSTNVSSLNLKECPALEILSCNDTNITDLDVKFCPSLKNLSCGDTDITKLDVSGNLLLESLSVYSTKLTTLNLEDNQALEILNCNLSSLTSLDVSKNKNLTFLTCFLCPLTSLDIGDNVNLSYPEKAKSTIDLTITKNTIDIKEVFPKMDISKMKIIQGGTLNGSVLTLNNTDSFTYTYECGKSKDGIEIATTTVKLHVDKQDSKIKFTNNLNMTYTGKPVIDPTIDHQGSTGAITFTYEVKKGNTWELCKNTPVDAGIYRVTAHLAGDDYYNETSETMEFTISQANGSETEISNITNDKDLENLTIKDGSKMLIKGVDYEIERTQNGNTVTVTIAFKGNYTGTITKTYTIETTEQIEKPKEEQSEENTEKPKEENNNNSNVPTGDRSQTELFMGLSLLTVGAILFLERKKKTIKEN